MAGRTASEIQSEYLSSSEIANNNENIYHDSVVIDGKEYNYYVCLPDDGEKVLAANVHFHGYPSAGFDSTKYELNYYNSNDSKTIGIVLDKNFYNYSNNGEILDQIIEKVNSDNDVTIYKVNMDGNSWGGLYAIAARAEYNVNHGVTENNFVSLYGATDMDRSSSAPRISEDIYSEGLKNTYLLTYGNVDNSVKRFKDQAAGIIDIENPTFVGGAAHDRFPSIAPEDGSIDFMAGYGELKNIENYTFSMLNADGTVTDMTYEDLKKLIPEISIEELYSGAYNELIGYVQGLNGKYFGSGSEWKWNNDTLAGELQDLVSKVSNLEYMNNEVVSSYESTTELPNAEAEKQKALYANVTVLLSRVDQIIEAAYTIQDSIQVTEKTKAEEASELDNGKTTTSGSSGLGFFDRAKATWDKIVEKAYDWLHTDPKFELPGFLGKLQRGMQEAHHNFDELIWGIFGYDVPPLEDKNTEEKEPLGHGGGGQAGGGGGTGKPIETEPEKPSSNTGGGGYYGGGSSGSGGTTPSPEVEKPKEYDIKTDFPEWDDVYTDDNRLVYESEEGYKVVIHHNQEEIIGVEHYYDFKTEESAKENYEKVINDYINEEYADVVIRKDQYIKMIYKEESYSGISLSKFKERFEDLKLVEKNK